MANATIEESVPLNSSEEQSAKEKRSTDEHEEDVEEKCRVEMWRCFSKVTSCVCSKITAEKRF